MKLSFCAFDSPHIINGVNMWLIRFLPTLSRVGYKIKLYITTYENINDCKMYQKLVGTNIEICHLPNTLDTREKVNFILNDIKNSPPDVFIPGNIVPGLYASLFLDGSNISVIGILHSYDYDCEDYIHEFFINSENKIVVCVSDFIKNFVRTLNNGLKLYSIPCGVEQTNFRTDFSNENFKIVYVGRIDDRQKRIIKTVNMMCKLANNFDNVEFLIVGTGPDEDEVKSIISKRDRKNKVSYLGFVEYENLKSIYQSVNALVLFSNFEGMPVGVMEAMSYGVIPICTSNIKGIEELITDNEDGFLIDDIDSEFEVLINKLSMDRKFCERVSKKAAEKIQNSFSINSCIAEWTKIFHEIKDLEVEIDTRNIPVKVNINPKSQIFKNQVYIKPTLAQRISNKIKNNFSRTLKAIIS